MTFPYQTETLKAAASVPVNTVSGKSHRIGMDNKEPLIVALDAMLAYAKAYRLRFDDNLSSDYFLGPHWLAAVKGLRGLLNGDGAVAMRRGITTDSKDNGACESVFWSAMDAAGFTEDTL